MGQWLRRFARSTAAFLIAGIIILVIVEGLSSVVFLVGRLVRDRTIAEERYARYDPELGWASPPNLDLPDFYGPGSFLRTNAQGFRNDRDTSRTVPPGSRRAICSGDSFTFGYGVSNDQTWCQRLAGLVPGLETINMGQGGYGIDQAFLWYRRDGAILEHQAQLFAFITHDFVRMQSDHFIRYGKPLLRLRAGDLEVTNVPVPKPRLPLRWLSDQSVHFEKLVAVQLGKTIVGELRGYPGRQPNDGPEARALAAAIFSELDALNRAKGSRLSLIYLPTWADYRNCESDRWRQATAEAAGRLGVPFVDLIPELRKLPIEEAEGFFIKGPGQKYHGAVGHYTERGNDWVARQLQARRVALGLSPS